MSTEDKNFGAQVQKRTPLSRFQLLRKNVTSAMVSLITARVAIVNVAHPYWKRNCAERVDAVALHDAIFSSSQFFTEQLA